MIELKNVQKIYENEKGTQLQALKNIHLRVEKGDIFAIIGVSGAGKSTMMRLMGLLEKPTQGKVLLDGVDTTQLTEKEKLTYCRNIGTVFQGYHLLMQKTVFQNVAFPLTLVKTPKDDIRKRVEELLTLVGLSDKKDTYPSKLSGGQKQRVAIARALATNPKLLLCDEPTSALDSLTTHSILSLLEEINQKLGVTVVIITHDMDVVQRVCKNLAVVDQGEVVEQGEVVSVSKRQQHPTVRALFQAAHIATNSTY